MNKIEDISPLAQLKELECLEIYQNPIKDISGRRAAKAQVPQLQLDLYRRHRPLPKLQNLEMLWFIRVRNVGEEQRQQLSDALKNCKICFNANSSGDGGWT